MNKLISCFVFLTIVFVISSGALAQSIFEIIEKKDVGMLEALVKEETSAINVPSGDEAKNLPIHAAVTKCSVPMTATLLEAGADINATNFYDHTPLHLAARYCAVGVVNYLVEQKADTQVKTEMDHFTPLHFAAGRKDGMEVAQYLIDRGMDVNASSKRHQTTPVINAIRLGHQEMIVFLVEKGADLTIGKPLYEAIQSGATTLESLAYLIDKGADVNAFMPLVAALSLKKFDMVKLLVERGAHVNTVDVINAAANTGEVDMLKYIVEQGADINQGDRTSLMTAAQAGHFYIVKYLLSKNVEVNKKTQNGNYSALSLSIWQGHRRVAIVLLNNGAEADVFVHAGLGDLEQLNKYSLEQLIHTKDETGRTPLFAAIIGQEKKAVEFLIGKGAALDTKTKFQGMTPLHVAVDTGNRDIVSLLVAKGADINAAMMDGLYWRSGFTPLDIAKEKKDQFMIRLLENVQKE